MTHTRRTRCRACEGERLSLVLDLGLQPLANAFLRDPAEAATELRFPLEVHRCLDCSLVQLVDVVDPEILFRDYIYVTGTSDTMARHNRAYAEAVVGELGLGRGDLVVEVASNDGSLLRCFQERGVRTLGVEPARNIAQMARERGIETVSEFFGLEVGEALRNQYGPAMAVVANNVLAHVDDTRSFLAGCAALLGDGGRVVVEFPYLGDFLARLEYDTVYHEHLCYFSILPLLALYRKVGLAITRIDRVPVHGGSLRIWAALGGSRPQHAEPVLALAEEERARGYDAPELYQRFAQGVARQRQRLQALLEDLRRKGARLAGYGALAKGNTLLNYCAIGPETLPFIVDRSPLKVGRWTPGSHIPVRPVAELEGAGVDHLLILAWNFADEIMEQQRHFAAGGGRFVLPLPEPRIIES